MPKGGVMPKAEAWKLVSEETVYKKYSQRIDRRDFALPDGRTDDFYIRIEGVGACAFGLTVDNEVITLPQFRPGPKKILPELPGGMVDKGEDPRKAAARELLEETGYTGKVHEWTGSWYSDAYTDSNRTIIIITDCKKVAEPEHDDNEFGEVTLVPVAEFAAFARAGQLTDTAGALLALDHLGLLH